jgi:hypothetical protein
VSLKQQRRWRAALVDVGLIFFSVLLAFWIEARWQDSQEAARQRSYLQGVAEDLTRVRGQLEEALAQRQAFDLATDSLLTATGRPDSTLSRWLWDATSLGRGTAYSLALRGLVSSATWADLDDLELRDRFAGLALRLQDLESSRDAQQDYWWRNLDPYLRPRIDYASWEARSARPAEGWPSLLGDQQLRNMLTHAKWIRVSDGVAIARALQNIDEVLARLGDLGESIDEERGPP